MNIIGEWSNRTDALWRQSLGKGGSVIVFHYEIRACCNFHMFGSIFASRVPI